MTPSEFREFEAAIGPTFSGKPAVYIYGLVDPESGLIRYIGKSIRPAERLQNHMNEVSSCRRFAAGERTIDLAKEYGVHRTTISKIKMGTYHDKYRD